ncbi:Cmk1 calcium/calmodulin-dependent protein kinase II [Candida orthopsilosis Co 90-125]|uniref:Cmk1 calcium/calmodulin-dependent protein kinase II n=1 Tax=Candida orthopsilosis (strain 90-125) TaxID=1136231 RepID=H8X3Q3_CANO9|nr:Cmk1 calcium/calmodulin-dependent protein kinase II [Candida orthopsilosis Co 90-125]CCG25691.1 Cmk1 calcium/calmodulin-dependent protein kinase II [Candida orthopsilosis Co 90-125]
MTHLYTKRFTPWNTESTPTSGSSSTTTIASRSSEYMLSKSPIGEGSYSVVYECKNKHTGNHYAAKKYNKSLSYGLESLLQGEFEILSQISMSHPRILSLFDYFETSNSFYFVTDLAEGGDLFNKIVYDSPGGKIEPSTAREIVTQLISAVSYLHSNSIVHRDIKPENILFSSHNSNEILLGDFGLARVLKPHQKLHDMSGTLSYMAPEMFNREKGYSFPVDVWAIGVCVYFMLCGYMPFDCETDDETKDAIMNKKYLFEPPDYWVDVPESAKDFILSCFETSPESRPTSNELVNDHSDDIARSTCGKDDTDAATFATQKAEIHKIFQNMPRHSQAKVGSPKQYSPATFLEAEDDVVARGAFCMTPECVTELNTPITSTCPSREQSWLQLKKSKENMTNKLGGGIRVAEGKQRSPAKFSI